VVASIAILATLHTGVAADPTPAPPNPNFFHILVPWHLSTASGVNLDLPPSYVLDEPTWAKLDTEVRRLQTTEVRLTAENKSLRDTTSGWQPGWYTVTGVLAAGLALGWYAHSKL
jgi:hypothetical protein